MMTGFGHPADGRRPRLSAQRAFSERKARTAERDYPYLKSRQYAFRAPEGASRRGGKSDARTARATHRAARRGAACASRPAAVVGFGFGAPLVRDLEPLGPIRVDERKPTGAGSAPWRSPARREDGGPSRSRSLGQSLGRRGAGMARAVRPCAGRGDVQRPGNRALSGSRSHSNRRTYAPFPRYAAARCSGDRNRHVLRRASRRPSRPQLRPQVPDELPDLSHRLSGPQPVRGGLSARRLPLPQLERQRGQRRRQGAHDRPRAGGVREDVPGLGVARQDPRGRPAVGDVQRERADQPAGLRGEGRRRKRLHVERGRGGVSPVWRRRLQRHADVHDASSRWPTTARSTSRRRTCSGTTSSGHATCSTCGWAGSLRRSSRASACTAAT